MGHINHGWEITASIDVRPPLLSETADTDWTAAVKIAFQDAEKKGEKPMTSPLLQIDRSGGLEADGNSEVTENDHPEYASAWMWIYRTAAKRLGATLHGYVEGDYSDTPDGWCEPYRIEIDGSLIRVLRPGPRTWVE